MFFISSRRRHTRSLRDWSSDVCSSDLAQYKDAEAKYGNGYLGLLPHMRLRGFRGRKLPEATFELITEFIENHYETLKQDRKSTRLNSSHVEISYAVFCLKKKRSNTVVL